MTIKLIVGLRNPGAQYAKTRHNVGAWLLETLPFDWQTKKEFSAEISDIQIGSMKVIAIMPNTFMNLSGQSVGAVARYYRIEADEILVIHDDLDLPVGQVRLKSGGGHGGHNGLQDIIRHIGSANFHRLRIGIGRPEDKSQVSNYVLHAPNAMDKKLIEEGIEKVIPYLPQIIKGEFAPVMNALHRKGD